VLSNSVAYTSRSRGWKVNKNEESRSVDDTENEKDPMGRGEQPALSCSSTYKTEIKTQCCQNLGVLNVKSCNFSSNATNSKNT
jgi:hypothetical protein